MFRLRSNWIVIEVVPRLLDDVISVTPAMWPNCRSSGVATDDAMISALAPGKLAFTEMVGKSTCGKRRNRQHRETQSRPQSQSPPSAASSRLAGE